ncbi:MAG: LysR substrate-binding domain-containing protein [Nocardioides sp.]|uniref:LysR substrate-binding domain-containing protein n=1 Tax=Nocardioides sp. TaxID=35761 RepID=UPI0039E55EBC
MELRHLRYFRAVAEELHFGRAAERLHMAQPPLSQQIRALEAELGVELLRRSTRRVELTPAGEAYLARAREILAAVEGAGEEARRIEAGLTGRLRLGCVGSATYSLLPRLARSLRERLPGIEVDFRGEMLAPDLVAGLAGESLDLALLRPPVHDPRVQTEVVRRDRLIVVLPEGHRLAGRRQLRIGDLAGEELIVHAGHGRSVMYDVVADLMAEAGLAMRVRHEVAETSTLVTFVAAGLGVALAPEPVAALGISGATYRPLAPARLGVDLLVARRAGDDSPLLDRATRTLRELL